MERHRVLGLVAGVLLVFGAAANAGQEPAPESTTARPAAVLAARANLDSAFVPVFGVAAVQVVGFVWYPDHTPVNYPKLQIRNLQDGRVVASTIGTVLGEFRFERLDGGSYLIELIDSADRVLAVGQQLALLPGEAVDTFIMLVDELADQGFAFAGGTGAQRFDASAPALVQAATGARVTGIGGGNAASIEQ